MSRFAARNLALAYVASIRPIADAVVKRNKSLADQLQRAACSAAHNTAEGGKRAGNDRNHAFRIAAGETDEAAMAVEIAVAWGYVGAKLAAPALALADRMRAILWRLSH